MSALGGLGEGLMAVGAQWQQRNDLAAAEERDMKNYERKQKIRSKLRTQEERKLALVNAYLKRQEEERLMKTPEYQAKIEEEAKERQRTQEKHDSQMELNSARAKASDARAARDARYVQPEGRRRKSPEEEAEEIFGKLPSNQGGWGNIMSWIRR